jgi:hypothetical protein
MNTRMHIVVDEALLDRIDAARDLVSRSKYIGYLLERGLQTLEAPTVNPAVARLAKKFPPPGEFVRLERPLSEGAVRQVAPEPRRVGPLSEGPLPPVDRTSELAPPPREDVKAIDIDGKVYAGCADHPNAGARKQLGSVWCARQGCTRKAREVTQS